MIALLLAIAVAGLNTGQNLLLLMAALLLSFLCVHWYLQTSTRFRIRFRRELPPVIFARERFRVRITLDNRKLLYPTVSISVGDRGEGLQIHRLAYFLLVPGRGQRQASYEAEYETRGLHRIDSLFYRTRFPFGILDKTMGIPSPMDVLVYPEIRPVAEYPPEGGFVGEEKRPRRGAGTELFGFHDYIEGEDSRLIHWPTSARMGRLLVKEFEQEEQREVSIILDDTMPEEAGESFRNAFEESVSEAASYAVRFMDEGCAVGLATSHGLIPPATGPAQFHLLLRELALIQPARGAAPVPLPQSGAVVHISWRKAGTEATTPVA
jgi:uncharacterized protein (DUF58 family)